MIFLKSSWHDYLSQSSHIKLIMPYTLKLNQEAHHRLKVFAVLNSLTLSQAVEKLILERTETTQKGTKESK